jgi:hypothetical protein
MSAVLRPRRRERLLSSVALLAALTFLWFSFPALKAGFASVAESTRGVVYIAGESLVALVHSPLFYIYGAVLGAYVLLRLMRRLQIRLM